VFWFGDSPSLVPHRTVASGHLELAAGLVERSALPALAAERRPVVDAIAALWDDLVALG
jgi:hypothetical protein